MSRVRFPSPAPIPSSSADSCQKAYPLTRLPKIALQMYLLLSLLALGCARHGEMVPQSRLDTADLHYQQGLHALDEGDVWAAQASFERARALDKDYPGVAVGTALVASAQGEFFRARKLIEAALHRDKSFVGAHVALAQIAASEGLARGDSPQVWLEAVRRSMVQATKLAPLDGSVPFRLGEVEFQAGEYAAARLALQRSMALDDHPWSDRAKTLLTKLQQIERSTPGSTLGSKIATSATVTRGELAVLLIEELHVEQILAARDRLEGKAPAAQRAIDAKTLGIELTWARPFIERLLPLGLRGMEPLPDGSFAPEAPVTRSQLAMIADGLLQRVAGHGPSSDRYTGEPSRFSDITSDHYAYAAIASVVARGVMMADPLAMSFRPGAAVDGAEALDVLRQLESALTGGF
jgi:Tfp pilus assembly protein PilF